MKKGIIAIIVLIILVIIGVVVGITMNQNKQTSEKNTTNNLQSATSINQSEENSKLNSNLRNNNQYADTTKVNLKIGDVTIPAVLNNIQVENENRNEAKDMKISVKDSNNHNIIFELNDSNVAKSLYEQLPLTIKVDNFSSNEKIFYPQNKLNTNGTPTTSGGGSKGTLAYYAPWGDVVMFYDSFGSASGLYELGKAVQGENQIENLSGDIVIEKVEN